MKIDSQVIASHTFTIDPFLPHTIEGSNLRFPCDSSQYLGMKVNISYRPLRLILETPKTFINRNQLQEKDKAVYIGYDYSPYAGNNRSPLINQNALNYNGSISRGFSVGNSQSLVLNSNLNLQLNGNLGNGINVVAAISDDNIPIQADGNTQLLQEFDKVFIRVSKEKTGIIAGDYDLQSGDSHFINYYKKLQGIRVDNLMSVGEKSQLQSNVNFAISRGKFARQILEVKEGNQGPYKLRGNNGERFLIVLSGSEKVYYDGNLLVRGLDNDYVIDYNNAEIIFTPQRRVSRESRIIVEYEYTDQNYLRSLYAINTNYVTGDYQLGLNFYSEQDSKNATGQIELDSLDIAILTENGDNPLELVRSGVRTINQDDINSSTVYYKRVYNEITGDSILQYVREIEDAQFTAFFSEVGQGNGDYAIDTEVAANGRVYKYVGKNMGTYLPIIQLIAPEKRQIMSLNGRVNLSKKSTLFGEVSLSNFDDNRFSEIDNVTNQGNAFNVGYELKPQAQDTSLWQPYANVRYEFIQDKFRFLNPFRKPEFNRDWNIGNLDRTNEHFFNSGIGIKSKKGLELTYAFTYYDREDQYTGIKHIPTLKYFHENTQISLHTDMLFSEGLSEKSAFIRPTLEWSQKFPWLKNWSTRIKYFAENNERKSIGNDILTDASFSFAEYLVALESPVQDGKQLSLFAKRRIDKLPQDNVLVQATNITEGGVQGKYQTDQSNLSFNLSYRNFEVSLPELISETNNASLLGRIDYSFDLWNGFIQAVSSYNIGSGQEAKREYQFIKVEKGEGNYIYLGDLNEDGEEQINEYEIAVFSDQADYIRVNIVNNEFIRTENRGINFSLRLSPQRILKDKKSGISSFLSRFTTSSIIRIDQKTNSEGDNEGISFFNFNANDSTLVTYNSLINNTLFFNRGNPKYDIQLGNRISENRFVQITGYEQRQINEYFTKLRFNPKSYFDLITELSFGQQGYDSEFFENKDLEVSFFSISPSVNYRPRNNLRFTMEYTFDRKDQKINEMEEARNHDLTFKTTWRQTSRSSMIFSLSLVNVKYSGEVNTPVAYNILSGLNKGKNYLWSLDVSRRLAGNLDLNINYSGRKTGDIPTVHVARAQVRASF